MGDWYKVNPQKKMWNRGGGVLDIFIWINADVATEATYLSVKQWALNGEASF